jgi:hypothetical protein
MASRCVRSYSITCCYALGPSLYEQLGIRTALIVRVFDDYYFFLARRRGKEPLASCTGPFTLRIQFRNKIRVGDEL